MKRILVLAIMAGSLTLAAPAQAAYSPLQRPAPNFRTTPGPNFRVSPGPNFR